MQKTTQALLAITFSASLLTALPALAEESISVKSSTTVSEHGVRKLPLTPRDIKERFIESRDNNKEPRVAPRPQLERQEASASSTERNPEARREAAREAKKIDRGEKLITQAKKQFEIVSKRLHAALDRLSNIAGRIDSRIEKLKKQNIDTSSAESLQIQARAQLADTKTQLDALVLPQITVGDTASSTSSGVTAALRTARAQTTKAEKAIEVARRSFEMVVKELRKEGGVKADADFRAEATTTENH